MSYRKIVYSLYAFMLCVAIGCTDKGDLQKYRPEMTGADYSVEIVPSDETLVISDIVDGYRLMEPKGVLLANIGEVLPYDSLFILSGISAEGGYVHLFDAMGNYQKTLLKKGQGPGEAVELNSLKVYGDDLYFLVNVGMKMMHYSLKDGLFVGSFPYVRRAILNGLTTIAMCSIRSIPPCRRKSISCMCTTSHRGEWNTVGFP